MNRILRYFFVAAILSFVVFALISCTATGEPFTIISGSENETLEPLIKEFSRKNRIPIEMHYKGSVDIMLELGNERIEYDAVWPANSLWISLGDEQRRIKHVKSIMSSPVVFGIRKSYAEELGFIGKSVTVTDILQAIQEGRFSFMMTSATQSNSGASAYIGFLYALLGNPDVITETDLHDQYVADQIRTLLAGIHRSSGSSGWLKDLFLTSDYDAMVNYEALIIETNQELERQNREPLYAVYPEDGIVIADSPLGYVNKGDEKKEQIFLKLQAYLLSDKVQGELTTLGRRTGMAGLRADYDPKVFRSEWGIDTERVLSTIKMPAGPVIREALLLYQKQYRKPSFTVFCLDYSGSMYPDGERQMKEAMEILLNPTKAEQYFLQTGENDVIVVIPFSGEVLGQWRIVGDDETRLNELFNAIYNLKPGGRTDIYAPVIEGLKIMQSYTDLNRFMPAVILMTDGEDTTGMRLRHLRDFYQGLGKDIPVFCIMFGEALEEELTEIAALARGRVFDGRYDLVNAFRKVKGYN